jgi:hypothetical protein
MSYIGQTLPADTFQGFTTDSFTGDGSATTFTLSKTPFSEDTLIVVINNVIQKPTTNFTVSGTTLTIVGTAVASGDVIYAIHMGGVVPSTLASKVDVNGVSDAIILDADADTTISADTDDQIDFKAGGTDVMSMTATGLTINDGTTITTADNTDTLTLTSTDADANAGPNLRLYRNSSSPAPNDVIGVIESEGRNDNSEDIIYQQYQHLIADETDGTEDGYFIFSQMKAGTLTERYRLETGTFVINDPGNDFDFRVESENKTNMLYVDASADHVAINSVSDYHASLITVASGERALFVYQNANSDTTTMQIRSAFAHSSNTASMIVFQDSGGTERGSIKTSGSATQFNTSSDYRLKENVDYDWDATTRLKQLKPARFNWIADDTNTLLDGFIAHEVSSVVPEAVAGEKDGMENYIDEDTGEEKTRIRPQGIDQSKLVPLMVKTIQELEARIKTLEDA